MRIALSGPTFLNFFQSGEDLYRRDIMSQRLAKVEATWTRSLLTFARGNSVECLETMNAGKLWSFGAAQKRRTMDRKTIRGCIGRKYERKIRVIIRQHLEVREFSYLIWSPRSIHGRMTFCSPSVNGYPEIKSASTIRIKWRKKKECAISREGRDIDPGSFKHKLCYWREHSR